MTERLKNRAPHRNNLQDADADAISQREGKNPYEAKSGETASDRSLHEEFPQKPRPREGYSIEAEEKLLGRECTAKEYDESLIRTYIDAGASGSNIQRPALKNLIDDASAGLISTVIVYKLDRLSRSQKILSTSSKTYSFPTVSISCRSTSGWIPEVPTEKR